MDISAGPNEMLGSILDGSPRVIAGTGTSEAARRLLLGEILRGVEWMEGKGCRRAVERDGVQKLHLHFPRGKLPLLSAYLNYRTGKAVLQALKDVCRERLGLGREFYLESVLVYRLHFPCGRPLPSRKGGAGTGLRGLYCRGVLALPGIFPSLAGLFPGYPHPTFRKPYEDGHAPHRDDWFGYALDSLNLWWAVEKVEAENGMLLFPGTFAKELRRRTSGAPYLAEGQILPEPHPTPLEAGEILALSTHELHATRLNQSESTRIVVSVRVSPGKPKFLGVESNPAFIRAGRHHPASRLDRGDFRTLWDPRKDPDHDPWGRPCREEGVLACAPVVDRRRERVPSGGTRLFPAGLLEARGRVAVEFQDREMVVFRTEKGPAGLEARCPHEGYRLCDGYSDGRTVTCPGHGMRFDLGTGSSGCGPSLRTFRTARSGDGIFLEAAGESRGGMAPATGGAGVP